MLILCFGFTFHCVQGGNILVTSLDTYSHLIKPLNFAKHLEKYGHHIEFFVPEEFSTKITSFGLKNSSLILRPNDNSSALVNEMAFSVCKSNLFARIKMFLQTGDKITNRCKLILEDKQLIETLKSKKFDLFIFFLQVHVTTCLHTSLVSQL